MSSSRELPALVLGIARLGYRGPIHERALSSLLAWASEYGVEGVLRWVEEDPGYLIAPSWQFPVAWQMVCFLSVRERKEDHVFHRTRRWCVTPVASAEELAEKLTEHTWTLCTAFSLGGYLFLNDATSEDGAAEFAVLKMTTAGVHIQIESITFSWCTRERALELIRQVLAGAFDAAGMFGPVKPRLDTPEQHGRCPLCA
jgi:hypothetical protein